MNEEKQAVEMAQSVRIIKENLPAIIEQIAINAQLERRKYLELVKQGFSEDQALKLCQKLF